jgi:anaerobic magnesium-protoporphyrin IX monomethyl ester cyclase
MKVMLVYVRDINYYKLLDEKLYSLQSDPNRVKVMAFPPLGIQTLAPVLRARGHNVRMFDTCHPQMRAENIACAIKEDPPDVIALSFLSVTAYPAMKEIAALLKCEAPEIPVIVGGVFASMNAIHVMRDCPAIDFVGVGEGEELLPDFLSHMDEPGSVAGLVWRNSGEIVRNEPRPLIQDLDKFPYPDRTSLPLDYVESLPLDVPAVLSLDKFCTIQTSRGCPYHCIYCDIPAISKGQWRSRSAGHVLGEMQQLNDQGYRSIYFTDDHFLINGTRISEICNGIIERKLKFNWGCEGRVDSVAVDQLPIMRRANCNMLAFGIEAGTQKVLDRLGKCQTLAQIEHAVGQAKKHGISRVHGFFVIGSPGETVADVMKTFRFAARLQLDTFGFNRLSVYRGTPLWKEYVDSGIIDDKLDWYKSFKCCDIDPTTISSAIINRLRMKGYALLFSYRIIGRPIRTWSLLKQFSRFMKVSDILKLLWSPFRGKRETEKLNLPATMLEAGLIHPARLPGI